MYEICILLGVKRYLKIKRFQATRQKHNSRTAKKYLKTFQGVFFVKIFVEFSSFALIDRRKSLMRKKNHRFDLNFWTKMFVIFPKDNI